MVSTQKTRKKRSSTNSREIISTEKARKILNLRKRNLSYRAIAERVGVSHSAVAKSLKRSLAKLHAERIELAEQWVEFELAQLEDIIRAARRTMDEMRKPQADEKGNPKTDITHLHKPMGMILKAMEQRAKLLGLYKPVDVNVTMTHEDALAELE